MAKYLAIFFAMMATTLSQPAVITPLGPDGGIITQLKGSLNDDVVLAVVEDNHLFRSIDGGESWSAVPVLAASAQNFSLEIYDIAIHPLVSDTIYMATSFGLFRSTNKGSGWNHLTSFPSPRYSIRFAPGNPAVLIGSDENGVLRSTDGGKTWMPLKDNIYFGNRMIRRVGIHPADSDPFSMRIVATTGYDDTTGIFITTDGGMSWRPMVNGLPPGAGRRIYAAEIDSTGLGKLNYRVVIGTGDGMYAMQTDYQAGVWQAVKSNSYPLRGVITGGTLVYDSYDTAALEHKFSLFVSSNGSAFDGFPGAYTDMNGIFKVESRFSTIISQGGIQPPITRVFDKLCDITSVFVPLASNKQKLYVGTSNGVYISTDGGANWRRKNNGLRHTVIRNLVSFFPNLIVNRNLFAGSFGGGIFRSTDDGITWTEANNGLTNPYVTAVAVDYRQQIIYAGSAFTIYRSTDGGKSWISIFAADSSNVINFSRYRTRENDMTIRVSPVDPNTILFRSPAYGLNISTDGGAQWTVVQPPPGYDTIYVPENVAFDPADAKTIYMSGRGIFTSSDLGSTWTDISSNLPLFEFDQSSGQNIPLQTLSPTINPFNTNEIFLVSVFDKQQGKPYRLFKSTNAGASWAGLDTSVKVYDVEFDRYDQQRLVASGPGGIFQSVNGGLSWTKLSDGLTIPEFYLTDPSVEHANTFYVGSDNGAVRIELQDLPHLTADTLVYDFGTLRAGQDSLRTVFLRNTAGLRNVIVRFDGLSDTLAFKYLGVPEYNIPAGGEVWFPVLFSPEAGGNSIAVIRFATTDETVDTLRIVLKGRSFTRRLLEQFTFDFGSVTVGKDSVINVELDNQFGTAPVTVNFLGTTDSSAFRYLESPSVLVDTGAIVPLRIRFMPRTAGTKKSVLAFTTSDPQFPAVQIRLNGTGVIKNFVSRRVLIDTGVAFASHTGEPLAKYYKFLMKTLDRADIAVENMMAGSAERYSSILYVLPDGPPPQEVIDSLQHYILNGGTVVAVGDFGYRNELPFNTFLHDTTWSKFGVRTGIRFNRDMIVDTSSRDPLTSGKVTAYPAIRNNLTNNVDSIVLFASGSLMIDSTVSNAVPLLIARAPSLISIDPDDTAATGIPSAVVAAATKIGKGKVIAIADYDIWWNGIAGDSLAQLGLFSGKNLQFALNVFGVVDNYSARLPDPTPQEAYVMISIPYSFTDSSVLALFKDLGRPNEYIWRMFGRWTDAGGYKEFPEDFKLIRRGEGYWLITKQPMTVDFGTTSVQGSEEDFRITLHPGFNMIGNPFPYSVSWADSYREDSTISRHLWLYDKGFDTTTQLMDPFRGYFIKNNSSVDKIIRINSMPVSETPALSKGAGAVPRILSGEWKLQLVAKNAKTADRLNYVGMLNNSSDGNDGEDIEEPPVAPGDFVSISIRNNGRMLAADYRPVTTEGQFWDFDVSGNNASLPIGITLNEIGAIPHHFSLFLFDRKKERVYDLTSSRSHTFSFDKGEQRRSFRILVGDRQFAESHTDGVPLVPMEYSLYQNYPNPFNPNTSIRYSIANSGVVTLDVFNLLGQKIKSLIHSYQSIGSYTVQWDGTDESKTPVATGIYYYRLHANTFTSVKKMTLIK